MPHFQYIGRKPETIVGLEPKNISEEEYDALPWDLQQAVLLNKGSDGGPLYVERMDRATVREFNANMRLGQEPEPEPAVDEVAPEAPEPIVVELTPEPAPEPAIPVDVPAEQGAP